MKPYRQFQSLDTLDTWQLELLARPGYRHYLSWSDRQFNDELRRHPWLRERLALRPNRSRL